MSSYTDIFSGVNVQPSQSSYSSYTLIANITMKWPLQFIDTVNVISNVNDVSASIAGFTMKLPDATQGSLGGGGQFNNIGANSFTVIKNDNTPIVTLLSGESAQIYLVDNSTTAGSWRILVGPGTPAVTSISAVSSNNNLTIAGSPITASGTFTFNFANDLLALTAFGGSTGLGSRTAANTWALRTLTGTANQISIVNGNGVLGNPTFSLPATITGINNLTVGNINLSANAITTTNVNGDLTITPNGTGVTRSFSELYLMAGKELRFNNPLNNAYVSFKAGAIPLGLNVSWTLPLADGTNGQVWQTNGLGALSWASVINFAGASTNNAIAKFNGIAGSIQNSGVIIDAANNVTGMNTLTVANLGIATTGVNTITSTNANGDITINPNGNGIINLVTAAAGETKNTGIMTLRPLGGVVSALRFYNSANTFYSALQAGNPAANITWNLPIADGAANALMLTDGAGSLNWTPAGAGKLVLISSQTAANSASISFSSNANTFPVYNSYYIVIRDLVPVNNDVAPYITVSTDGGATWANANYYYDYLWVTAATPGGADATGINQSQIVPIRNLAGEKIPNAGDTANTPYNATFKILNASSVNYTTITGGEIVWHTPVGTSRYYAAMGQGTYQQAIAVNGIKFALSGGNIASGVFTLYGLNT